MVGIVDIVEVDIVGTVVDDIVLELAVVDSFKI
jgi:hypothetical protein